CLCLRVLSFMSRLRRRSALFPYTTLFRSKSGLPFYYLPDMDFGERDSIFVPFFGVPAATITGLARIAALTGAVVVPAVTTQLPRSEEHTSELQSRENLVCRLLLEKKNDTS